jgi:Fe2+ or Zn2+ uptake regulation protein
MKDNFWEEILRMVKTLLDKKPCELLGHHYQPDKTSTHWFICTKCGDTIINAWNTK